ncbi:MAG TPA: response regulator, partial [Rhodopila sp.]
GSNGTGLGLASVQGFIAQSGGEFSITSRRGEGTIVELHLPAATEGENPVVAREPPFDGRSGRLLFVDDAPDVLVTVSSFLRSAGFDVVPAWGPDVALRALREDGPFDCLVTDFSMPHMNGLELITQARQISPGLPALLITAWMEELQATGTGTMRVLRKPFRRDALVLELQRMIAAPQTKAAQSLLVEGVTIREQ